MLKSFMSLMKASGGGSAVRKQTSDRRRTSIPQDDSYLEKELTVLFLPDSSRSRQCYYSSYTQIHFYVIKLCCIICIEASYLQSATKYHHWGLPRWNCHVFWRNHLLHQQWLLARFMLTKRGEHVTPTRVYGKIDFYSRGVCRRISCAVAELHIINKVKWYLNGIKWKFCWM